MLAHLVTVALLMLIIKIYMEGESSEAIYVESYIDGNSYLVRNLPDKVEAANNIALVRGKLNQLVHHLSNSEFKDEDRIRRLISKYRDDVLAESPENSKHTSYSINKGERIFFCLRQRDDNNQLVDLNTVTFVALHELSHVMTESVGHTKEFWDNFKFLLTEAIKKDIYKYHPYHETPVKYCGTVISDTPLTTIPS